MPRDEQRLTRVRRAIAAMVLLPLLSPALMGQDTAAPRLWTGSVGGVHVGTPAGVAVDGGFGL